jgi:hypothetical protein
MKESLAILLGVLLLISTEAVQAQWEYSTNADGTTLTITNYTGPGGDVTIPTNINGLTVISIGQQAFLSDSNLTSVTIPGSVTNIGDGAFAGCRNLLIVTIINGVTSIGEYAFGECSGLTNIAIPGSVTSIGNEAFVNCESLTSVTILGSGASIGDHAFLECVRMTNLTIGNGVTSIGNEAFGECDHLTNLTIPGSVTNIGIQAFQECVGLTNLTIPGSVTNIGIEAFDGCIGLTNLFFQGNAPTTYENAFEFVTATVYYLPGTTGWGDFSTNNRLSVVLWDPQIQTGGGSFGVSNNDFGFNITNGGTTNIPIVVEACTNLAGAVWTPLQSLTLTNAFYFGDPQWTNYPSRYYRISAP